jgi:hypothetical protein
LYAQWTVKGVTHTVTFNNNFPAESTGQVSVNPTSKNVVAPATTVGTLPTAPQTGTHNFTGWNLNADGSGGNFASDTPVTASISVYAQWVIKPPDGTTYTVTFNDNFPTESTGRVSVSPTSKNVVTPATTIDALPTAPQTDTHNFAKWTLNNDGTGGEFLANTPVTASIPVYAQWTVKPPVLSSIPVKVGSATQNVAVTASEGATVTYIENGYEVEISNYGKYAWFKVDLGEGKKIANFTQVKFNYEAIKGDIAYKTICLLASDTEFPASLNESAVYEPRRVSTVYWGKNAGTEAITCTIGTLQGQNATTYVSNIDAVSSAREVYVCVYIHASGGSANAATTFSVKNIEFVPAPAFTAVTNIINVPDVGEINKEVDLTKATAFPSAATNKTIVWSLKAAGTTGVTEAEVATGKFTPTTTGTISVTATIANGATATTPYTKDFEIGIRKTTPTEGKQIVLTDMAGDYVGTLDSDGYGFTVTGGCNYEWTAAIFNLNLGDAELKDVVKVTFDYIPLAGDYDYKPIYFAAITKNGTFSDKLSEPANGCLGTVQTGGTTVNESTPLEIVIDYTLAKAIEGSEVKIAFVVSAADKKDGVDTSFKINNIKFWVAE